MAERSKRVGLITGANRGLGRSMALHLAANGVGIIGTYRSHEDEAADVAAQVEATGARAVMLRLDTGKSDTFAAFVEQVRASLGATFDRSTFDYLVNNAGIGLDATFAETTEEQFDELIRVQIKGPFFLTQRLLPLLADGGRILNVSSGLTRGVAPRRAAYALTKGAIDVLTRHQAQELAARRITVNAIAPGVIATDFGGGHVRDDAEINRRLAGTIALGRVGEADDIGAATALLLSDGAGWITGQRIEASGGQGL